MYKFFLTFHNAQAFNQPKIFALLTQCYYFQTSGYAQMNKKYDCVKCIVQKFYGKASIKKRKPFHYNYVH